MEKTLRHIGEDSWGRQVYEDENGRLWKDLDNREGWLGPLYSCGNDFDGEPCSPMKRDIKCTFIGGRVIEDKDRFTYMMLGRLQSDFDYFLGYGNRNPKNLWAGSVKEQIAEMKKLWNCLKEDKKPEWLSMNEIEKYEKLCIN